MSADIGHLGGLQNAEPIDFEIYKDAQEGSTVPKAGRYTVRAPESFPATSFGAAKSGFLSAAVDPTVVGPTSEGTVIRFTKVSAKPFQRGGVTVSQIGDYLRACGYKGKIGGSPQELADAVAATAGTLFEVELDWKVYNKNTGFSLEGMKNFPKTADGYQSWIEDKDDVDAEGNAKRLRANLVVRRFYPAR